MNIERTNKVLVVGATGTVGSAALRELLATGVPVRALVRSERSALKLQRAVADAARNGTPEAAHHRSLEVVHGDLRDPAAVAKALSGVCSALYVSPHEVDEEQLAATFIAACEKQKVRLVFVGVHVPGANRLVRLLKRTFYGLFLPHYRPKFRIAERARTSTASPIVLMPSNFYQNDELFQAQLFEGHYVQPFERPINRVDVRDVGRAAARACTDATLPSGAYPVFGPESLDAARCATTWSEQLGLKITYPGVDSARVGASLAHTLTGKKLDDFQKTYVVLAKLEAQTSAKDVAATAALLGRAPLPYAEYVRDTLQTWRNAARAAE